MLANQSFRQYLTVHNPACQAMNLRLRNIRDTAGYIRRFKRTFPGTKFASSFMGAAPNVWRVFT